MTDNKNWLSEYETFVKSEEKVVPKELSQSVMSRMDELLNPSAWNVFAKVLGIHLFVGFLSLGVCHQFGMNPFGTEASLDSWFMAMWGHHVCMLACGTLFTGASLLTAGFFLKIEELKSLRRTEFIQALALGSASIVLFAAFGAELALAVTGLWILGAVTGGVLATEAIWRMKQVRVYS